MQYTFCAFQACESSIPLANNFVLDIVLGHLQEIAPPPTKHFEQFVSFYFITVTVPNDLYL